MRDLGLPSFDDPVGSVGLGEEVGGGRSQGPGSAAVCQKFQLGETLPVVPARIVRRVLRGDFVDMAELTEDNLELELRRGSEADEGPQGGPTTPDLAGGSREQLFLLSRTSSTTALMHASISGEGPPAPGVAPSLSSIT